MMKSMYATKNEHSRIINEKMMKTMITMTIMLMALIILAEKVSTLPYLRDSRGEANIGGKEADTNHNILQYVKVCE